MSDASTSGAQPQSILQSNIPSSSHGSLATQFTGAGSTSSNINQQTSPNSSDVPQNNLQHAPELQLGSTSTDPTPAAWEDKGAHGQSDAEHTQQQDALEMTRVDGDVMLDQVNPQIELTEHIPDATTAVGQGEEMHDWENDHDNHELKRVKVYELVGSRWVDQGTAFCFGQFDADTGDALLIARAERDYNEIILSTTIRSSDVYQRQQDTLIVWTEPDGVDYALSFQDPEGCSEVWSFITEVQRHMNNADEGGLASSPVLGAETSGTTFQTIIRSGHLPPPQLGIISEIERAIKSIARTQAMKERICEYIQHEEYVKSLIEVMRSAEDLESLENLHAICSLMQTILMLNDHNLYEHIVEDDLFLGVAGILEYDPEFPSHKANYREFLENASTFHQPIPINDLNIRRKVHHTYRLQFLKDVILARALDDSTFNVLNSCIIFNQIDIINHVQQDPSFLREIVKLFVDEEVLNGGKRPTSIPPQRNPPQHMIISLNGAGDNVTKSDDPSPMDVDSPQAMSSPKMNGSATPVGSPSAPRKRPPSYALAPPDDLSEEEVNQRREVILLIQQLCAMGKNVQLPARMALFRALVDRGILFAVQWALNLPEKEDINKPMIAAAGEILSALLDHDLNGVRGHVLKQVMAIEREREAGKKGADKAETILEMACRMLAQSMDLSVQTQIGDALRVWLDLPAPDANGANAGPSEANHALIPKMAGRKDDPGTERFMDYFYKQCINTLFKPFVDLPEWRHATEPIFPLSREQTNRYVYCCDLLYNFVQQHHFRSHFYIMATDVIVRIATLLKTKDKHLRHASFRIFRLLLKLNNANLHAQIMKHDILKPILNLTLAESRRDNLLSCSCQEYFESMRKENMKELIKFCMKNHEEDIKKLAGTPLGGERFKLFISRYEMNSAPPPMEDIKLEQTPEKRGWPDSSRSIDAEEEDYFNTDDDDDANIPSISQTAGPKRTQLLLANSKIRKRRGSAAAAAAAAQTRTPRPTLKSQPPLTALWDYGDDEEEEIGPQPAPSSAPSPALSTSTTPPGSPSPELPTLNPKHSRQALKAGDGSFQASIDSPSMAISEDEEDEEDLLLESLVRSKGADAMNGRIEVTSRPSTPGPGMMASMESIGPMRQGGKRRRGDEDEDEDDELLARLTKVKKSDHVSPQKNPSGAGSGNSTTTGGGVTTRTKNGDDPPKFKVKFGASILGIKGSTPPAPTTPQSNDGGGGSVTSTPKSKEDDSDTTSQGMTIPPSTPTIASEVGGKDGDTG